MDYVKDVLVSTDWVAQNLNQEGVRLIEVDEDILLYDTGHIQGAVKVDWQQDFWDPVMREFIGPEELQTLLGRLGLKEGDQIVLYGDKSNWWAAYAYWFLSYNGVQNLKLMNGGRQKWVAEGRELTTDAPSFEATQYPALKRDESLRAYRDEVKAHIETVRSGGRDGGCPQPRRVLGQGHPHAQLPAGGRAARRPHPRRGEYPLGPRHERGRYLQDRRRAEGALRG